MKKKTLTLLATAAMAVVLSAILFVACDKANGSSNGSVSGIVNTSWKYVTRDGSETINFKANGKGTYIYTYDDSYSGKATDRTDFTYTYDSKSQTGIIMIGSGYGYDDDSYGYDDDSYDYYKKGYSYDDDSYGDYGSETYRFEIEGNHLYLENRTYTKM